MVGSQYRIVALVVAAGESRRMGEGTPKQYRSLGGKAVLRHTVEAFLAHPAVDAVCVVIHPDHAEFYAQAVDGLDLLPPVHGGTTRQQSVKNGVEHLFSTAKPEYILVHDAARCFVDAATISRVVDALQSGAQAVVPALPVADTLKKLRGSVVESTLPRDNIYLTQTPQCFDFELLNKLHMNANSESFTDDAALAEEAGIAVTCVAGSANNFKLTTAEDWQRAERTIQQSYTYRTGMGYDVHRLIPREGSRLLMLCGVAIAHDFVLEGHSDADVGLHALTDAILGALALGDIGTHFPPSDPQWKGADSAQFIAYCTKQLQVRGAVLTHVDITLICEAPKIAPHRAAMQERVATLLWIDSDCVSIKATTSEGLGFTGRREGIAAQAVATIHLPKKGAL